MLFEAPSRQIKKAGRTKLHSAENLKAELDGLAARKTALQAELRKIQREEKEYGMIHQNIDTLLSVPIKPIRQNSNRSIIPRLPKDGRM